MHVNDVYSQLCGELSKLGLTNYRLCAMGRSSNYGRRVIKRFSVIVKSSYSLPDPTKPRVLVRR
jgi:hypothetical protein